MFEIAQLALITIFSSFLQAKSSKISMILFL